ncbi:FCD domain-containing protein [Paracoccus mutanolyticus]|nr:FCD domain-containing protein [Paracoccus mutanolyticus]
MRFAANQRIHEAVLGAAKNHTLTTHYRSLSARVQRARYVANTTPTRWAQAVEEHEEIMTHLRARDGAKLPGPSATLGQLQDFEWPHDLSSADGTPPPSRPRRALAARLPAKRLKGSFFVIRGSRRCRPAS